MLITFDDILAILSMGDGYPYVILASLSMGDDYPLVILASLTMVMVIHRIYG
jgi:hypothetical protein